MFYLSNKHVKVNGIPYLFGGIEHNNSRVGFSNENDLIINEALSNEGGILFFFWAGYSYNDTYQFERLQ